MRVGFIVLLISSIGSGSFAQERSGLGLGFVLGAPTGISFAAGPVQGALAYSFLDGGSLVLVGDYKVLNQGLTEQVRNLNWYLGPGLVVEVFFSDPKTAGGRAKQSNLWIGGHADVGLSWMFQPSWELFGEIGPGIYLFPAVNFLVTAGLGLRYYFGPAPRS